MKNKNPMTPATVTRIQWEEAVLLAIEHKGFCRSDAQSLVEAKPALLDALYDDLATPGEAAKRFVD